MNTTSKFILGLTIVSGTAMAISWPDAPSGQQENGRIGSLIYPDVENGRVGIGTTEPLTELEISSDSPAIILSDNDSLSTEGALATSLVFMGSDGVQTSWIGDGSGINNQLSVVNKTDDGIGLYGNLGSRSTPDIKIDGPSGNVGIGTTNPQASLDVADGQILMNGFLLSAGLNNMVIGASDSSQNTILQTASEKSIAIQNSLTQQAFVYDDNDFEFRRGNVLMGTVDGNVGIGTTDPIRPLHLLTDVADSVQINRSGTLTTDDTMGLISFQTEDSAENGNSQVRAFVRDFDTGLSDLRFRTRGIDNVQDRMTIDHVGNVGIGTTSPGAKLHIDVDSDGEDGDDFVIASTNDQIQVGIGVPVTNLTAFTSLETGNRVKINSSHSHLKLYESDSGNNTFSYIGRNAGQFMIGSNDEVISTEHLVVLDNGNVGIGTTSPMSRLEVDADGDSYGGVPILQVTSNRVSNPAKVAGFYSSGGTATAEIFVGQSATNDDALVLGFNNSDDYGYLQMYGDAAGDGLVIANGGNVGIGTTNPGAKLEVSPLSTGTASNELGLFVDPENDVNGDSSAHIQLRSSNNSTDALFTISNHSENQYASGGPRFVIGRGVDGANITDPLFVINSIGNVGIGTTDPVAKLDIEGGNYAQSNLRLNNSAVESYWEMGQKRNAGIEWFSINRGGSEMIAISDTGNIGIGTTDPEAKLDIDNTSGGQHPFRFYDDNGEHFGKYDFTGSSYAYMELKKDNVRTGMLQWSDSYIGFYVNSGKGVSVNKTTGNVGIGTTDPGSKLSIVGLVEYTDNAAAKTGGLIAGDLYRTGDLLKIVHD